MTVVFVAYSSSSSFPFAWVYNYWNCVSLLFHNCIRYPICLKLWRKLALDIDRNETVPGTDNRYRYLLCPFNRWHLPRPNMCRTIYANQLSVVSIIIAFLCNEKKNRTSSTSTSIPQHPSICPFKLVNAETFTQFCAYDIIIFFLPQVCTSYIPTLN